MTALASAMAELLGLAPSAVGEANLDRAARARMRALGLESTEDYLRALRLDPDERRLACGLAIVGETWFFRDPGVFDHLGRQALAMSSPVRVLCAPCSTGEEAYGAALALMGAGLRPNDFLVDAFDANADSVASARSGLFGPTSFRNPPAALMRRFADMKDGRRRVPAEAGARVRFQLGDLLAGGFGLGRGPYHFVLCRNFAMYLDQPARLRLGATLSALMDPEAVLYVGHAEVTVFAALGFSPLGLPGTFACVRPGAKKRPVPPEWGQPVSGLRPARSKRPFESQRPVAAGPAPGDAPSAFARADATERVQASDPAWSEAARTRETRRAAHARPFTPPPGLGAEPEACALPDPDDPRERAVRALADAGRLREALTLARTALDQGPPTAELFHLLAAAHLGLGQKDQAERALRRAIYLCPGHVEALTLLELLSAARGDDSQAALLARRADRAAAESGEAKP